MLRGRLVGARWFAEAAAAPTSGGLKLNFFIPGHLFYSKAAVERVTVPGLEGDFGVLESHVPSVAELRPGVVTIDKAGGVSERYFVSGGFAMVHKDDVMDLAAVEAVPVDALDADMVAKELADSTRKLDNATDELAKAEAQIQVDVATAMQSAMSMAH